MQQNETSLPVFVFPTQLSFYIKDTTTHRHLITIYNPYDFVVSYQGTVFRFVKFISENFNMMLFQQSLIKLQREYQSVKTIVSIVTKFMKLFYWQIRNTDTDKKIFIAISIYLTLSLREIERLKKLL